MLKASKNAVPWYTPTQQQPVNQWDSSSLSLGRCNMARAVGAAISKGMCSRGGGGGDERNMK